MENLFKDAKFGDKFVIKGCYDEFVEDKYVIFWQHIKLYPWDIEHYHKKYNKEPTATEFVRYITKDGGLCCVDMNGKSCDGNDFYDIVSRYNEPIDEEELHNLAITDSPYDVNDCTPYDYEDTRNDNEVFIEGFKVGYRKAKM